MNYCHSAVPFSRPARQSEVACLNFRFIFSKYAGKAAAAQKLLKERLSVNPENPQLLCAMGDLTKQVSWYSKAWEMSGKKSARRYASLCTSTHFDWHRFMPRMLLVSFLILDHNTARPAHTVQNFFSITWQYLSMNALTWHLAQVY
jgi:hypothetical protein